MSLQDLPHPSGDLGPGPDPEALLVACHPLIAALGLNESHLYPPLGTRNAPNARFSHEHDLSVKLVKALVAICNSRAEEHSPKYCVALAVTAERSDLYYASDEIMSTQVIEHVEACLAILRKISSTCKHKFGLEDSPTYKQRSGDDDIRSAEDALIVRVYRFCYAYLRLCMVGFEKNRFEEIVWTFNISKKIARFRSNSEDFDVFCNKLGTVYAIIENAVDHSQLSDEEVYHVHRLLKAISRSAKEGVIKKVLEDNTIALGVLGTRFIEKICSLACSVNTLIHFAMSIHTRDVVEKFPSPIWIPPLSGPPHSTFHAFISCEVLKQWSKSLNHPLKSPSRLAQEITGSQVPPGLVLEDDGHYMASDAHAQGQDKVHPECILINYILKNNIDVYPVIGSSQISCYGCEKYVHAVNKVYGKDFLLCDSSNKRTTLPWRYPAGGVARDDEIRATMASDVFHDLATVWNARCANYRAKNDL